MPISSSGHITRTPLTDFSIKYGNDQDSYVARKLFPEKKVPNRTGSFYIMSRDHMRSDSTIAPSGSEARAGGFSYSNRTFTLAEHAWKDLVLARDANDMDYSIGDLNKSQAEVNMDKLLLGLEIAAATKATTAANYPSALVTTLSGGATWADTSSDPMEEIRALSQAIFEASGVYPNTMVASQKTIHLLGQHAGVRDYMKYVEKGRPDSSSLASLFGFSNIWIANASKNTANQGATDAISAVWADNAVLAYVNPSAGLRSVTYGMTLMRNNMYTKQIDAPLLGRDGGAHWVESGWEWALEFGAQDSTGDAVAGGLIANTY